jgi:WD40 repeat protein
MSSLNKNNSDVKNNHNKWLKIFFIGFLILANYIFWQNFLTSEHAIANEIPVDENTEIIYEKNSPNKFEQKTKGLLMFRGTPYRNFYGTGPLNTIAPEMVWKYPNENSKNNSPLCARSFVGNTSKIWCGSGWTGQPVVWVRPDGVTEIITNTYDKGIHFINADNGTETRAPFYTGDIIKGTVTMDPDNYPLLYSGSRDNFYRIIALDRGNPVELWRIEAKKSDGVWNDDWDPNGIILNDILYTGSENGWFHAIKLNRSYDALGKVTVAPVEIFKYPTYSDGYIQKVGDDDLSVESSPLLVGNTIYITNSGGRILGFDIENITQGVAPVVFDFWTGDDTDATLVADKDGFIYSASEYERNNEREKIGQILKLDPKKYSVGNPDAPLVWGISVPKKRGMVGGLWATPAIRDNRLYVPTNPGDLLMINTDNGKIIDSIFIGTNAWSSPALIDDNLIVGTCEGKILNFNIEDDKFEKIWEYKINSGSCVESSPAVWQGQIFFGARDGYIYSIK